MLYTYQKHKWTAHLLPEKRLVKELLLVLLLVQLLPLEPRRECAAGGTPVGRAARFRAHELRAFRRCARGRPQQVGRSGEQRLRALLRRARNLLRAEHRGGREAVQVADAEAGAGRVARSGTRRARRRGGGGKGTAGGSSAETGVGERRLPDLRQEVRQVGEVTERLRVDRSRRRGGGGRGGGGKRGGAGGVWVRVLVRAGGESEMCRCEC